MMSPTFSIIIPAHNEEHNIGTLLETIAKQSYRDFEVIVSDSDSQDETCKVIEGFRRTLPALVLLEEITQNVAAARNNGAKYAKGEYLVFFDADVFIEKHFFKEVIDHIEIDHPSMMTMWNRPTPPTFRGRIIFGIMNHLVQMAQNTHPAANGPCIIMKRALFESVEGFDQTIFFGEDYDIVKRAHQKGGVMKVYKHPLFFVSTRRFEKEGLLVSLYKSISALVYQFLFGPVRKPIFEYEMGGQYYEHSNKK
ncbi:MAG: glycosyltransferase family A protein [bacterium]